MVAAPRAVETAAARPRADGMAALLVRASAVLILSYMPLFLTGAVGFLLADDLSISLAQLGTLILLARVTSAGTARWCGRMVDRHGPDRAGRAALALSAASLAAAAAASGYVTFALALIPSGLAAPLSQASANVALARHSGGRKGLAFAIKQSSMPAAITIAGLSVAGAAARWGWQALFVAFAVICALAAALMPAGPDERSDPSGGSARQASWEKAARRKLLMLAFAFGLAMSAALSLGSFATVSSVTAGLSGAQAARLLAVGGVASIVFRLAAGMLSDRYGAAPLRVAGVMLLTGSAGYLLMAFGSGPSAHVAGVLVAFGLAWGFNGMLSQGVVQAFPARAGAASGQMLTASSLAGIIGPAGFGALAEVGLPAAWAAAAVAAAVAGAMVMASCEGAPRQTGKP